MARALLTATVADQAGNVVQNASVAVYETGTTTPVADLYAAASGGSPIASIISDSRGQVTGWLETPRVVDLYVTDNSHRAYRPLTPSSLLTFTGYTKSVSVEPDPTTMATSASVAAAVAAEVTRANSAYVPSSFVPSMPASLGWDTTNFPFSITSIADLPGTPKRVATVSVTPEALFDARSTARSAPGATFYVDITGADANNGLTAGAPFKSIWKAVVAANAAAVPTTIFVKGGTYFRTNNPWYNGGSGVVPTVDIAFIATNGRAITGTFDPPGTPSRDGTQTNTYSWAVASVNKVCDMAHLGGFGNYVELTNVSTAALCNATPDSWALVAGTLYVNRRDQAAVSNTNTRVYRPSTKCFQITSPVSIYIGGLTAADAFDCEGSSDSAVLDWSAGTPGSTLRAVVAKNSTFKYAGGITDTGTRGVSVESLQGIAALFNCRADANQTDGFNFHNTHAAANMNVLTVNCSAFDNGRSGQVSCNGWTTHEDVKGIDVAGHFKANHGGTCRSINTSKSWLAGTVVEDDFGDLFSASGTVPPTAFRVDDTATYWCDQTRVSMAAGGYAYVTAAGGATIHKRNVGVTALVDNAIGTIDTY